tara:strand:- start:10015 stop:10830 length:816 start_codon:yes stop_codon:yes gene_type:complete
MRTLADRHNVQIRGQGDSVVVFAHGFGCDQIVWQDVSPALEDTHRTVLFDLAGAGRADPDLYDRRRHSTLDGYAADLIDLLDELGFGQVQLVAHSVGAMIAALAAIRREDLFSSIVMIGPSACYLNHADYHGGFEREMLDELIELMDSNYIDWAKVFAPIVIGNPGSPEYTQDFIETLCRTDPKYAGAFARVTFFSDCRAVLGDVRVPTTVLECQEDPVAPPQAVGFVHDAIPDSRLIRLDATGHCPHITHPDEIVATLNRTLAVSWHVDT